MYTIHYYYLFELKIINENLFLISINIITESFNNIVSFDFYRFNES